MKRQRYFYKVGPERISFSLGSDQEEKAWNSFCQDIQSRGPEMILPTKEDYLSFMKKLEDDKRIRDAAPELFEVLKDIFEWINIADHSLELYKRTEGIIKKAKGES